MNRRDGNTGMATMSLPFAMAMSSDENDISHTSNSSNFSWRQNVSDGFGVRPYEVDALDFHVAGEERRDALVARRDKAKLKTVTHASPPLSLP